jgi:hypothetical protein
LFIIVLKFDPTRQVDPEFRARIGPGFNKNKEN